MVRIHFTGQVGTALEIMDKKNLNEAIGVLVIDAFEDEMPGLRCVIDDIREIFGKGLRLDEGSVETDEDTAMFFRLKHSDFTYEES